MNKKVDGKMIFTWHYLAFHDIPGLVEWGFLVQWYDEKYLI